MRLIDADALKNNICLTDEWGYVVTLQDINDAPTIEPSGDIIRRADAIEAVCGVVIDEFNISPTWGYEVAEKALSALPSADAVQGGVSCQHRKPERGERSK